MADIRINSLPTTASASSSDDFLALDGATNGTRKLNAYSPTFGGNLTVSGTTSTITLGSTNTGSIAVDSNGGLTITPKAGQALTLAGASSIKAGVGYAGLAEISNGLYFGGASYAFAQGDSGDTYVNAKSGQSVYLRVNNTTVAQGSAGAFSVAGNLTVSGTGTSSVAGKLTIGAVPTLIGVMSVRPVANGILNIRNAGEISANSGAAIDMLNDASDALTDFTVRAANYNFLNTGPVKVGGNLTVSGTGNSTIAGYLGVAATPSAWLSSFKALQVGTAAVAQIANRAYLTANWYYNSSGSDTYIATDFATIYRQQSGDHHWLTAPSGTAGTAITFDQPMTLKASGNLLIGTTTDGGQKLQVNGTANVSGQLGATKAVNGAAPSTSLSDYALYLGSAQSNTYVNSICWSEGTVPNSAIVGVDAGSGGAHGIAFYTGNNTSIAQSLYLDNSQNATFAGRVKAGTAYGTAKSVEVNQAFADQTQNTTKTITVTLPDGAKGATFVLEVGAYGNSGTGYGSLFVKGAGYLGSSTTYDAYEVVKVNSGNVTVSSVTKGNSQLTFTVINTSSTVSISVKLTATAGDDISTLPSITIA